MERKKILIYSQEAITKVAADRLRTLADVDTVIQDAPGQKEDVTEDWIKKIRNVDVLMANLAVNEELLKAANNLRYIQRYGIGYDNVDIKAATRHGVIVCNVAEIMAESVAQHAMALMLALSKDVVSRDSTIRGLSKRSSIPLGFELWDKTLGIIGLGSIGQRVAFKCRLAFNMRVLAYDPFVLPAQAQFAGAKLVDLPTLMEQSDVVSISCMLTPETYHLIGKQQLDKMKESAILINTARGPIIDEKALIEHLQKQKIRAAGLDVTEQEPTPPGNPLLKMENVILTGHSSAATIEAKTRTIEAYISNVERYLAGQRPHWMINPKAWQGN